MNQENLQKLLQNLASLESETEIVEFKENNFNKIEIGKRISALANSANFLGEKKAYLVFGVNNNRQIVGTKFKPKTEKVGSELLEAWLNKMLTPKTDFYLYEFIYDEKDIVLLEISPAFTQPIKFQNIAYIRINSTTPKLQDYPEKERKIWQNIEKNSFEKGIAKENLTVSEVLDLLDYAKYFSLTKQKLPTETIKFVEKMVQHGLANKNFDNDFDITNLGAILFAKDLRQFPTVKRKAVRVILYKGNSKAERIKEQEGNLGYAIAFENLIEFINDKLPSNEEIAKALRKEVRMYPKVAIREFVANALIHQDFTISGAGPTIEIFDNRVEITNTGDPLIPTERFIDHPPQSRNEDLASFMRQINICEEGGTGVDRALINIAIYQLPAPTFEKYNNFTKITLFVHKKLKDMTMDDKVRACYQHCVLKYLENNRMTNSSLRERLGISEKNYPTASKIISESIKRDKIKESEKIKEYIPIWA